MRQVALRFVENRRPCSRLGGNSSVLEMDRVLGLGCHVRSFGPVLMVAPMISGLGPNLSLAGVHLAVDISLIVSVRVSPVCSVLPSEYSGGGGTRGFCAQYGDYLEGLARPLAEHFLPPRGGDVPPSVLR